MQKISYSTIIAKNLKYPAQENNTKLNTLQKHTDSHGDLNNLDRILDEKYMSKMTGRVRWAYRFSAQYSYALVGCIIMPKVL